MSALSGCGTLSGITGSGQGAVPPVAAAGTATNPTMVGGLIAGSLGEGLGSGDRRRALEAEYRALEYGSSGQPIEWSGSWSGRSGKVVPAQPYRVGSQDCRQYTHTIASGGQNKSARGTACRNADGSWATLG